MEKLQVEVRKSHELLFSRTPASSRLGERFYGVPLIERPDWKPNDWIRTLKYVWKGNFVVENIPTAKVLKEFPYLAPRLVQLLERMENWKPRTFPELFIPGYVDRTNWWVAMFGIFFGVITVLDLVLNAYQVYLAQRQVAIALNGP